MRPKLNDNALRTQPTPGTTAQFVSPPLHSHTAGPNPQGKLDPYTQRPKVHEQRKQPNVVRVNVPTTESRDSGHRGLGNPAISGIAMTER